MSVGIDMALEERISSLAETRQILGNIELNWRCRLTKVCGDACFLNQTARGLNQVEAPELAIVEATREFIESGCNVRHLALAGKEVLETPERVFLALECYHNTPVALRPGSIGLITAYPEGLINNRERFKACPLSWLVISIDTFSPLHRGRDSEPLLEAALDLQRCNGTDLVGVNTTVTDCNVEQVIALGQRLERARIHQWSVGQMKQPMNGSMVTASSRQTVEHLIERVCQTFGDSEMLIIIDVDYQTFCDQLPFHGGSTVDLERWRLEHQLTSSVLLTCGNPYPGFFLRVRFDMQLLDRDDLGRVGKWEGRYGSYSPGQIAKILPHLGQASHLMKSTLL